MDGASMAEADALALVAIARRDLARFTDFAVQIRYDDQPERPIRALSVLLH